MYSTRADPRHRTELVCLLHTPSSLPATSLPLQGFVTCCNSDKVQLQSQFSYGTNWPVAKHLITLHCIRAEQLPAHQMQGCQNQHFQPLTCFCLLPLQQGTCQGDLSLFTQHLHPSLLPQRPKQLSAQHWQEQLDRLSDAYCSPPGLQGRAWLYSHKRMK